VKIPRPGKTAPPLACLTALVLAVVISGCGGPPPIPAAASPPAVPGETTQGPDLAGIHLPNFVMPLIHGGVSIPNRKLTPGAVTTTDANVVCTMQPHSQPPKIPIALQTAVFDEYGYTSPSALHKHVIDWLVPYNLGGAAVLANIWPAAVTGTGFYEKNRTDAILRMMVCRRDLTLAQAQHAMESNWYSAWLRYVVATGHL
jgi:hypothetical protein